MPRWRAARDLQIMWYDLWRRRAYISQGRHVASQKAWRQSLVGVGSISSKEMFDLAGVLGTNAGWKELLTSKDAPTRLTSVIQTLQFANANIVGTCAHRATLRHIHRAYDLRFGPPLTFVTPNFADTKSDAGVVSGKGAVVFSITRGARTMDGQSQGNHSPVRE